MNKDESKLGVAIVGCGTVGGAAAAILTNDAQGLRARCGMEMDLLHIVDVDFSHAEELGLDSRLFRTDLAKVLADTSVDVVVELVGGTTKAREIIKKAIAADKHVVTANKALLAHHGVELWALARRHNVCIGFEASCGGGIPIIRALCGGLIANRIDALFGIVNGTCNYILTAMMLHGQTYAQALGQAQSEGLAEADPTLDVAGVDSAHKLAIMGALAFARQIDFEAIPTYGIDDLDLCDIRYGQELGYVVKLLAIAQRQADGLSLRVRPAFISKEHPLAWVSGPFNAISVYGHAIGHTMYYGRGAGGLPTASAAVADITAVAVGTAQREFAALGIWPDRCQPADQLPIEAVRSRYYIRVIADDQPGVLAQIAAILGRYDISICSVLQHESLHADMARGVPVVITTYHAREGNVQKALREVDALEVIKAKTVCLGIVDEHPEEL
ncbi:MAG: homoserine dehydrogenase [Phycisphaerae bacterium]|jgi:homoserine dehydrogenase|nr:homoserine dehydrogenase [Phycisphaerae bacterium]